MIRIGPYKLTSPAALAPTAGVTDLPFRRQCRRFGAGLAASDMIISDSRLWDSRKTRLRLSHDADERSRSVQIAGSDPAMMVDAARRNVALGVDIIDINRTEFATFRHSFNGLQSGAEQIESLHRLFGRWDRYQEEDIAA